MKVLSVPGKLRLSLVLVVLCVPLAALETVLYYRAPWWNLPYGPMTASSLVSIAVFAPLGLVMGHGWKVGWRLAATLAVVWLLGTTWVAVGERNFWLGVFVILLAAYWISVLSWVRVEMGRSFFDPRIEWFEGHPRPIPGLKCEIGSDGQKIALKVSRLDRDGLFAFRQDGPALPARSGSKAAPSRIELTLEFRGRKVSARAKPVRLLSDGGGVGLKFYENPPDRLKELGDFVELLRGEGYVG